MTESGTIAFIGGMELDTTLAKYAGYGEAASFVAEEHGKSVTVLDPVYSGDFSASDKGLEFAKAMMDEGADVFFGDASAVDSGARQAIDEANEENGEITVYDIAQPADLLGQNDCVIGSQVTDNAVLIELSMKAVEEGEFGGETLYGTLQNGVLSAGALNEEIVPVDVQEEYAAYIQQMEDGTFMS
jgi:basic membrane protein A